MPTTFDHLLDYKLLPGSHEFPGEAGGACINEAAIVASRLDYREFRSPSDCPPCFSRPIAGFAMALNDGAGRDHRQALKRFVMRLAGTADGNLAETARGSHALFEVVRYFAGATPRSVDEAFDLLAGRGNGSLYLALNYAQCRNWADAARFAGSALIMRGSAGFEAGLTILDGMLAIGKQAPGIDQATALERLTRTFGREPERVPA